LENKVERLIVLAQKLADDAEWFFEKKGEGAGDLATNAFMD